MKSKTRPNPILSFFANNYLSFGLLISASALIGSLFLSEILHFPPCDLCWYQRSMMYPQAILFGVALWKNDRSVDKYILPLSIIGLAIAVYHYIGQINPSILPCTNAAVSCATKQIEFFGFITIPFMSGAAFLVLILLSLAKKKFSTK
jgi:disulfide bond formation protein DsbB